MSMPDWPYLPHLRWLPRQSGSASRNWLWILPKLGGRGCESRRFKSGLGSNRSIWLGPPVMNRKMQRLALAGKWPGRGASGPGGRGGPRVASQQIGQPEQPEPAAGGLEELAPAARSERLRAGTAAGQGGWDIEKFLDGCDEARSYRSSRTSQPCRSSSANSSLELRRRETRQDVAAVELLASIQPRDVRRECRRRRYDSGSTSQISRTPDAKYSPRLRSISAGVFDSLNTSMARSGAARDRLLGNPAVGEPVPRDKSDVRNPNKARKKPNGPVRRRDNTKISGNHEIPQDLDQAPARSDSENPIAFSTSTPSTSS